MSARKHKRPAPEDDHDEIGRLAMELGLTAVPPALADLLPQAEQQALSHGAFARTFLTIETKARHLRRVTNDYERLAEQANAVNEADDKHESDQHRTRYQPPLVSLMQRSASP